MSNKIRIGDIVELIMDWDASDIWRGNYKQCFIPKGTKLRFIGKSLCAHFELLKPIPTWKDGRDTLVLIPYSKVFKVLKKTQNGDVDE